MSHRVIAGKAKGRKLKLVAGDITRPIMDRVKEALFSILGTQVVGCSFLDLFGGTGAVGIEALSRGAAYVRFIDKHRVAIQTIHENLAHTQLEEGAEVLHADALAYLERENPPMFEIIYIAPPQYKSIWKTVLAMLDKNTAHIAPDGLVIVQIDPMEYEEDLPLQNLVLYDERRYGNTLLLFYEFSPDGDENQEDELNELPD
jgi:16S rRNA (guanine(966)-N(2))-methyltransferase RsmD